MWQTWIGTGLAGLAPAAVALAIHTVAMLLVVPHGEAEPVAYLQTQPAPITSAPSTPVPVQLPVAANAPLASVPENMADTPLINSSTEPLTAPVAAEDDLLTEPSAGSQENVELPTSKVEAAPKNQDLKPAGSTPTHSVTEAADAQRLQALKMAQNGLTQSEIGEHFGVSKSTISRWLRDARQEHPSHLRLVSES